MVVWFAKKRWFYALACLNSQRSKFLQSRYSGMVKSELWRQLLTKMIWKQSNGYFIFVTSKSTCLPSFLHFVASKMTLSRREQKFELIKKKSTVHPVPPKKKKAKMCVRDKECCWGRKPKKVSNAKELLTSSLMEFGIWFASFVPSLYAHANIR